MPAQNLTESKPIEDSQDKKRKREEKEKKRQEKKKAKKEKKKAKLEAEKAKERESSSEEEVKSVDNKKGKSDGETLVRKESKKQEMPKSEPQKVDKKQEVQKVDKQETQKETPKVVKKSELETQKVDAWRAQNNVTITGTDCPAPYQTFASAAFPKYISTALETLNFSTPTPIQAQCWPLALGGRDLVGLAETGSGKTLAFMIPGIVHICNKTTGNRSQGPSVLVLAPTRELAQQIEEVTAKTCGVAKIKSCCVYGGVTKSTQVQSTKGAEVIIATPGRLIDLVQDGTVKLSNITYLVLDEADRMLDMGFELQINEIMKHITSKARQTLMFSATWPSDVQRLAQKFFTNPIRITIGSEKLSGAKRVTQIVEICEEYEKKKKLKQLLEKLFKDNCRILIFMLYKKSCESLGQELQREGWPIGSIHGDKAQGVRNQVLADFKSGVAPIMIATDVAARGLDIKEVKYVINVEFPLKCEDYVHRIGRTGRAGEAGIAYTFFTADDKAHARELVQIMRESDQKIDDKLLAIADKAPGIKPKKTAMQQLYGDFASSDPTLANKKPTRIVFDS